MILRRRREARPIDPSRKVNPRQAELETAKEILAEIFGVWAVEVEEMIQSRMEERSWETMELMILVHVVSQTRHVVVKLMKIISSY